MNVFWTETSLESYFKVIDYLTYNYTDKQVDRFVLNVEELIERLKTHNQICPQSKLYNYRKCLIDEYNSLIYQNTNNTLIIITFIDNRGQNIY